MEKERLPENIWNAVHRLHPDEDILNAISADITAEGIYGEGWLVVTDRHILTFSAGSSQPSHDLRIDKLETITAENVSGAGFVQAETASGTSRIISYTKARSEDFHTVVDGIKTLMHGGMLSDRHRTSSRVVCPKCQRPIPKDMTLCPYCTEKRRVLVRLLAFSRPHLKQILVVLFVTLLMTLSSLITPYMSKLFIDYVFKIDPETGSFMYPQWHLVCVAIMLVAFLVQSVFAGIHERVAGTIGFRTVYDVRAALYRKLQDVSLAFFDKRHTGYILARINQDTAELQRLLVDFIPMTADILLSLLGVGTLLFVISWRLTLFVLLPILATVLFLRFIFPIVRSYFHRYFHRRSRLTALVSDSVSGVRVVKSFGQEQVELDKFDATSSSYRDSGIELIKRWSIFHPAMHLLMMSGSVIVWLVGGRLILRGQNAPGGMTVGDVVAYAGYLMMFYRPVFMLTRMSDMITNALAAGERVLDILDVTPEIRDDPNAEPIESIEGEIELRDVHFGYDPHEEVIKGINLTIKPNEMVGLVGKSGVGKSTIINLVSRLYDVNQGAILIDGVDLRKIRQSDLRSHIGVVLQDTFLFSGSIMENISYARPDATKEDIIAAAIAAHAHDFIVTKPDGYDTIVGERGSRLSGGEKQRISIARAVLRDPRILILDEATSSVDVQTEEKIQHALDHLTKGRTTIAIAHRLATLRNCDRLVVLDEGKVLETGSHAELMEKKGAFYELAKSQEKLSAVVAVEG